MKIKDPLVTIITITKNRSNLISRCIESIQKQTYRNYEHIIADGGTDDTESVVKSYNDSRIKYIKVAEGGPVVQTKKSFELSAGDYITFLDDDDEYLPQKIEKQVQLISSLPDDYGFIYGSMTYYDAKTNEVLRIHRAEISGGNILPIAVSAPIVCGTPTLMFRRAVFEAIGGTWIAGIGNEMSDMALVCKTLKMGWKVGALTDSYLKIYVNHGAVRLSDPTQSIESAEKNIKFHNYFLEEYKDIFIQNHRLAQKHLESLVFYNLKARHFISAIKKWTELVKAAPTLKSILYLPYYSIKICMKK